MRVTIVDDDPTTLKVVERALTRWGYEPQCHTDSVAAWKQAERDPAPGLWVVDWSMPVLDGIALTRRLRAHVRLKTSYVLMLTSRDTRADLRDSFEAGVDDYLVKPCDPDELRLRVGAGARLLRVQRDLEQRIDELARATAEIQELRGMLPICMHCHKIRDPSDRWDDLVKYVSDHTNLAFSHCLCPDCLATYYPEDAESTG